MKVTRSYCTSGVHCTRTRPPLTWLPTSTSHTTPTRCNADGMTALPRCVRSSTYITCIRGTATISIRRQASAIIACAGRRPSTRATNRHMRAPTVGDAGDRELAFRRYKQKSEQCMAVVVKCSHVKHASPFKWFETSGSWLIV